MNVELLTPFNLDWFIVISEKASIIITKFLLLPQVRKLFEKLETDEMAAILNEWKKKKSLFMVNDILLLPSVSEARKLNVNHAEMF